MTDFQIVHTLEKGTPLHPSWIEIDCDQFAQNLANIRQELKTKLLCLPVKANAYGHGIETIGKLAEEGEVDYLGVAHLQEGIQLREAGVQIPILVLGAIDAKRVALFVEYDLEFSLSSPYKAALISAQKPPKKCRVHLEVDTGMQRTGMRPQTARQLFHDLQDNPSIEVVGIYSHFATADRPGDPVALRQIEAFQTLITDPLIEPRPLIKHLCNSGGMIHHPQAHFDMVRPGLLVYGYFQSPLTSPCFSLKSRVVFNKIVEPGEGIGYGHTHTTSKRTRIVTLPIGYGDGYPRALSNKGSVLIRGKRFPIVGTICMDQLMVDVGDNDASTGDEAVLIGKQDTKEISLQEVSTLCGTIPYEILTSLGCNTRLPRVNVKR